MIATLAANGSVSSNPISEITSRVDPRNQPGGGLLTRDATWSVPLFSLPGRAGLGLGLALSYSSQVWTTSGPFIYFDEDNGFPSPGFRLGFPIVQRKSFDAQTATNNFLLITGSGQRVELRQVGTSNIYEAGDSSYLQLTDNGSSWLVRASDGTQMTYAEHNNEYHCVQVKDRNGNFLTVNYNGLGRITTITDTLTRVINFNYDSNQNLLSITQAGKTAPWVTFGWTNKTLGLSFSNVAVIGTTANAQLPVINQVAINDGSYFQFDYNNSLQVSTITRKSFDNVQRAQTSFTYQSPSNDAPRLTASSVSASNWTGINGVPSQVTTNYSVSGNTYSVTAPDGTVYSETYGTGWQKGLVTGSQILSGGVVQKWTTSSWTQDNTAVSYETNPRVTETNVYDAGNNRRRTTIEYTSQFGLPQYIVEYAADGSTWIKRTHLAYALDAQYVERRIIGLLFQREVFDGSWNPMERTQWNYDEGGEYMEGLPATPTQHDGTNYPANFIWARGNITKVKRYDVTDYYNESKVIASKIGYNLTGAVRLTRDGLDHQSSISYTDAFSDSVNRNTFAYPTTMTDADGFSSSVQYHFVFGATTRTQGPPPAGQSQGAIQTILYDSLGRLERVTTFNNGAYKRFWYGPDYTASFTTVNTANDEAYATTTFDGLGRPIGTASNHPGSTGGYKAQITIYDQLGRAIKVSNPAEINGSWNPAGDDAAGWLFTQQTYNWQGKPLVTTNPDGTTKEASYSGCGCAGGEVVTLTDEGTLDGGVAKRRQQKIYSDVLGRTVKTEILNWQGGSVYSATVNTYNMRDQITQVRQFAGPEGSGTYQDTTMSYDGYGRLKTKHVPVEASGTMTTWSYNPDDTIASIVDANDATATFTYNNNRGLVNGVTYVRSGAASVTKSFNYDAVGNRTSMTDAAGSTTFHYDQLSRMDWEERSFTGLSGTYRLSYAYNLAYELTTLTYPTQFGTTVTHVYDTAARLTNVTSAGTPSAQLMTNIKYRAWGGVKEATHGDGIQLNLTYDARLLPARLELSNVHIGYPTAYATLGTENEYYADGQLKFARDLQDDRFDRKFAYDHAARLKEAYSGREARGLPPLSSPDNPYRQSYSYDVWGNMGRTGKHWSMNYADTPTYANNRRPDWSYDNAGKLTSRDSGQKLHTYDAASAETQYWEQIYHPDSGDNWSFERNTINLAYEGNGQPAKRTETREIEDIIGVSSNTRVTYYLRSSVLGGAVLNEIDPTGGFSYEHYYVGGQKIATRSTYPGNEYVSWRHANPLTGVWVSQTAGGYGYRNEMDPLGADVGLGNPYVSVSSPSYPDVMGPISLYEERGNPFDWGGGCGTLDGLPISCSEFRMRMQGGSVATEVLVPEVQAVGAPSLGQRNSQYRRVLSLYRNPVVSQGLGLNMTLIPVIKGGPVAPGNNNEGYYLDWDEAVFTVPQNYAAQERSELKADRKLYRNEPPKYPGLTPCVKEYLSKFFDRSMLDAIKWDHGIPLYVPMRDARAFTLDDMIYFGDGEYNPLNGISDEELTLIAHEVAHSQQYRQNGSLRFKGKYLLQSAINGVAGGIAGTAGKVDGLAWIMAYYGNKYEKEAEAMESKIAKDIEQNGNPCK